MAPQGATAKNNYLSSHFVAILQYIAQIEKVMQVDRQRQLPKKGSLMSQ